jgi:hypothetical protein
MAGRARLVGLIAGLCVLLAPSHDASARRFQMSGTWVYRIGTGVFLPLQFASPAGTTISGNALVRVGISMGNLTEALGFPNGPIPGEGGVTATGSAPATLRIPPHRFVEDAMAKLHVPALTSPDWILSSVGIDAPYAAATLAPGGGPGSFTWCPGDPACAAGGGMRSTDPPQGAGARNGRIIYRAGANRFGGAMQLGLRRGVTSLVFFNVSPLQFARVPAVGVGSTLRKAAAGGLGSADVPSVQTVFLPRAFVTQPTMPHTIMATTYYPGPKVTTMLGVSTTGTGALVYFPTTPIATGPMGTLAAQVTTHYGFGQTTGTVIVQQSNFWTGFDFFTVMGSDARTPLGAGNLSLVAGGLNFHNSGAVTASFQKVKLTLAPPIPSLSPAGLAAATALVLLAAGYAMRSRMA